MTEEQKAPERIWAFEDSQGAVPRGGYWCDEQSETPEGTPEYRLVPQPPLANDAQHGGTVAVEVKPLVWVDSGYTTRSSCLRYIITCWVDDSGGTYRLGIDDTARTSTFSTIADAKASAEAYHRARILSQITTRPASEIAAEARKQALEEAAQAMNPMLRSMISRGEAARIISALAEGGTHD